MQKPGTLLLVVFGFLLAVGTARRFATEARAQTQSAGSAVVTSKLHEARVSPSDLEVGGELAGLPPGTTRYITREDLLALPQMSYTVTDDSNFVGATRVSGVLLEELARRLPEMASIFILFFSIVSYLF